MRASWLFEVSWEVCNKVGGIHTVVTSKVPFAQAAFPEGYTLIGPYINPQEQAYVFEEHPIPSEWDEIARSLKENYSIVIHYGAWLIPGKPQVILIDWQGFHAHMDGFKATYWESYGLDTLGCDFYDYGQPLAWSTAIGLLLEAWYNQYTIPCVVQVHEWMSGGVLLHLNHHYPEIRTVFTTHATVLGRALSARELPVFNQLDSIDPTEEAKRVNVQLKHHTEALSAQLATVFSTVSTVTAAEASKFLGRDPVVTPNALDLALFPSLASMPTKHQQMRELWDRFVTEYFKPFYPLDPAKAHYQFTMGRYEMHNKGYDFYLDSLARLNKQLQESNSDQTVIAFFLVIGENPPPRDRAKDTAPGLSPYALSHPESDQIIQKALSVGLDNSTDTKVKVLYFPSFLDGHDGLMNRPLYDLVAGFDLGIFTSWYEPWGYTPMESMAAGVPAVTSNLSGFGQALAPCHLDSPHAGAFMCDRLQQDTSQQIKQLADIMKLEIESPRAQWELRRYAALLAMHSFTWDTAYPHYLDAYEDTSSVPINA